MGFCGVCCENADVTLSRMAAARETQTGMRFTARSFHTESFFLGPASSVAATPKLPRLESLWLCFLKDLRPRTPDLRRVNWLCRSLKIRGAVRRFREASVPQELSSNLSKARLSLLIPTSARGRGWGLSGKHFGSQIGQGWSLRSSGLRETQVRNAQCLQPGWFDQRRAAKICNFDLPLGVGAGRHENVGGLQVLVQHTDLVGRGQPRPRRCLRQPSGLR